MSRSTPQQKRVRNKRKIRSVVSGTSDRPRLSVFRSNNFLYAQLIDDTQGVTLVAASDHNKKKGMTKRAGATQAGTALAAAAQAKGITTVVFDRNGFKYAGRVRAFAEAAREAGLIF
ncbi:MAG TPA: 50S ribosomal protein L18 [Candidatus Paceibacterota bacterium]|nr:50S ribosomal protein L18 [Candidatus Paceibacterota bacterium]